MDCEYTKGKKIGNSGFRNSCMWLGFSGRMQEENIPEVMCFNFYFGTGRRIGTTDRSIYI